MAAVNKKVQLSKANDDIEEVDFAAMLEESFKKTEEDSDGIIVDIKDSEVFVNVGKKSEGILDISEIQDENGEIKFKVDKHCIRKLFRFPKRNAENTDYIFRFRYDICRGA